MVVEIQRYTEVALYCLEIERLNISSDSSITTGIASDINGHDILKRVYSPDGKSFRYG